MMVNGKMMNLEVGKFDIRMVIFIEVKQTIGLKDTCKVNIHLVQNNKYIKVCGVIIVNRARDRFYII